MFRERIKQISYHDLDGRPGFKLAMQVVHGKWFLYLGHLWHSGWSIVDVTDPASPRLVNFVGGPDNTWTLQVQAADGLLLTALEPIPASWGGNPDRPSEEGLLIWDLGDPLSPRPLGHWRSGASGTHRNYYAGGRYAHLATGLPGYRGRLYGLLDLTDPSEPQLVGKWAWPGQAVEAGESWSDRDSTKETISLHGAPYAVGDRVYCSWAGAGMVILDISDVAAPKRLGFLDVHPPLGSKIAVHSVVPLSRPDLVCINSEAIQERCDEAVNFAAIVDVSDPTRPRLISLLPTPLPPSGYPVSDFCDRGGRFGPHNQHQFQDHPALLPPDDHVYMTYFNAGLQVFDVAAPRAPKLIASFIPDDPAQRIGPLPTELVVQAEDLIVDARGYIYMTEKNSGLYVLSLDDDVR